jgi:hypothetical protein
LRWITFQFSWGLLGRQPSLGGYDSHYHSEEKTSSCMKATIQKQTRYLNVVKKKLETTIQTTMLEMTETKIEYIEI